MKITLDVYLNIEETLVDPVTIPGPRLVLLGDRSFTGPLTIRLDIDSPHGFPTDAVAESMPCRLRGQEQGFVLAVGPTIEVAFELHGAYQKAQEREQRYRGLFYNSHSPMLLLRPATGEIVAMDTTATVPSGDVEAAPQAAGR